MAKFHIAANGKPEICKAEKRACPLGAETPHGDFNSAQEASAWAESYHAQQAGGTFTAPVSKKASKPKKLFGVSGEILEPAAPGVSPQESGWVTEEMLTAQGRIDPKYLDDNYGFPKVFGELSFAKNSDGSYDISGSKQALAAWLEEDDEGIEEYKL